MDLATLTNAPKIIKLSGLAYKVRALTFREWGELQGWVKSNVDDPVTDGLRQIEKARAKGVNVSPEAEATLLRAAREDARQWPPEVMTSRWFGMLGSWPGGSDQFLLAMLRPFQPTITEEQVTEIGRAMDSADADALLMAAIGRDPSPKFQAPALETAKRPRRKRGGKTTGRRSGSSSSNSA